MGCAPTKAEAAMAPLCVCVRSLGEPISSEEEAAWMVKLDPDQSGVRDVFVTYSQHAP